MRLLLESSKKARALFCSRSVGAPAGEKRKRLELFDIITKNQLRTVRAVRAFADQENRAGHSALAEYCTRQGQKLEDIVENAWAIADAPHVLDSCTTLMDKLAKAAQGLPCKCDGQWQVGAEKILRHNAIDPLVFCRSICRALRLGAKRMANVAVVGNVCCGKSTLLEPLRVYL